MATEFAPRNISKVPAKPPRLTGNWEVDRLSMERWFSQFYQTAVLETGLLDPTYQSSGGGDIDPLNLPDPEFTTIARAQATANLVVRRFPSPVGSVVFTNPNTQATIPLDPPMPDDDYIAIAWATDFTGTPPAGALLVSRVTPAANQLTINISTAPGIGNTVTISYLIVRRG